jgi:hypothetical protein
MELDDETLRMAREEDCIGIYADYSETPEFDLLAKAFEGVSNAIAEAVKRGLLTQQEADRIERIDLD